MIVDFVFFGKVHGAFFAYGLVAEQAENRRVVSFFGDISRLAMLYAGIYKGRQQFGCAVALGCFTKYIVSVV